MLGISLFAGVSAATASGLPAEAALMESVAAANRVSPLSPSGASPLALLLLAVTLTASLAPALAGGLRAGADAVREAARKLPRPAFCAGLALAVSLFCEADKFPTNPVQSIIGILPGGGGLGQPSHAVAPPAVPLSQSGIQPTETGGAQQQGAQMMPPPPPPTVDNTPFLRDIDIAAAQPAPAVFLTNWISSGIAQHGVTPGIGSAFASAPSNAVRRAGWDLYGVSEDWITLPSPAFAQVAAGGAPVPPEWRFPFGGWTGALSRAHAASSGIVSFDKPRTRFPGDPASAALAAPLAGIPLGIAPDLGGDFWMDAPPYGPVRLTWRNVFANRDTNMPVSVQVELDQTGEMAFRYHAPAGSGILALPSLAAGAWRGGGGDAVAFDPAALADGLEIRWKAFGEIDPEDTDPDGDGLDNLAEIFVHGTSPYRPDTDFDGLSETNELALGTSPLDPDSDGDLAADSIDPEPLTFNNPTNILACCDRTWLFHVHNGLPADGSGHTQFPPGADAWAPAPTLHIRVTLNAPVPAPGAVLWVADVPLVMRDPGEWNLWLNASDEVPVALLQQRDFPVDYTVTSDTPGFVLVKNGTGWLAAMPVINLSPATYCVHSLNTPITFKVSGSAAKLPGQFVWIYGNNIFTNKEPSFTIPNCSTQPWSVHVTFSLSGSLSGSPYSAMAATDGDSWPATASAQINYCQFAFPTVVTDASLVQEHWWCELTRTFVYESGRCSTGGGAVGWGGEGGTNRLGVVPVLRRSHPWPSGHITFLPHPEKAAAGTPPSLPAGDSAPNDCGHLTCTFCEDEDEHNPLYHPQICASCMYLNNHWHRREMTFGQRRHGCCNCPAHNPTPEEGSPPPVETPVRFDGAHGVAVSIKFWTSAFIDPASSGDELWGSTLATVTGEMPSHTPNDRTAHFSRIDPGGSGETFHETDHFTVMSLDLWPDVNLDGEVTQVGDGDAIAPDWDREWTIPAGTNTWRALQVFNDVALPGTYRVNISGAASNICVRHGDTVIWADQTNNAVSFPPGSTLETLGVQAFAPGDTTLTVSFTGAGSLSNYMCSTSVRIRAYRLALTPDYDRDGEIINADHALAASNAVLRIWINDDRDGDDIPGDGDTDIPGQTAVPNHADPAVNGTRDLVDFFSVEMDIRGFEELCGAPDSYRLKHAGGAVNAVYTRLGNLNAGWYLTHDTGNCGPGLNSPARTAVTIPVTAAGTEISPYFVSWLRQTGGRGVFLIEGASVSTAPLVLEAVKGGTVTASCSMPLRVAPVESFFAHINLRGSGGYAVTAADPALAQGTPPGAGDPARHFVFVHGYNVSEAESRAWNAETFKRLWQSGLDARYHAVTWLGNEGQTHYNETIFPGFGWRTPDYYLNVRNAFNAAPKLANYVQSLDAAQGDTVVVAAHSLGNMLVSAAIQDHSMSVSKYFMLNAAVPSEAYDGELASTNIPNPMVHDDWNAYNAVTWSANWHTLFPATGAYSRNGLTWRGRFAGVASVAHNFYSSGDEVFEVLENDNTPVPADGYRPFSPNVAQSAGRYSWQKQEMFKGRDVSDDLVTPWFTTSDQAGWGFRGTNVLVHTPTAGYVEKWVKIYTLAEANALTENEIRACCVFHPNPSELFDSFILSATRTSLLAYAIPALSQAAGARPLPIPGDSKNVDMNAIGANGWWRTRSGEADPLDNRWLHSDMKEAAFLHVHPLYRHMIDTGELK